MFKLLRKTCEDKLAGFLRLFSGLIFFTAGILKLVVPTLGEAYSGQLTAANIPFYAASLYAVPVIEMVLGVMLLFGLYSRVSAAIAAIIMIVATYVHIVADDPSLFPLQPVEPIGPLLLLVMLMYVIWKGGGSWSIDLRETAEGIGS